MFQNSSSSSNPHSDKATDELASNYWKTMDISVEDPLSKSGIISEISTEVLSTEESSKFKKTLQPPYKVYYSKAI